MLSAMRPKKTTPPPAPAPPVEYSLADAAVQLGCSKPTVKRYALDMNLGRKIGNMRLITAEDIARIKAQLKPGPGNPDFGVKFKGTPPKKPASKRKSP